MNVESRREGTNLVLMADGRVDGTNATEFQDAMKSEIVDSDRAVILDLENLTYISSAGLRVVLLIAKDLAEAGRQNGGLRLVRAREGSLRHQRLRQDHPHPRFPGRGHRVHRLISPKSS